MILGTTNYGYDKNTDYAALMQEAAAKGDYKQAAVYEQQRNEKIAGEGIGGAKEMTNNFGKYLGESNADRGYGYGYTTGNKLTQVTDKNGNVTYTNATRLDDPALKSIDINNIKTAYSFNTPGGVNDAYEKRTIAGGPVWEGSSLTEGEQRALTNERAYRDALAAQYGITLQGSVEDDKAGGTLSGGGLTVGRNPYTGGTTANPYASLLEQTMQQYENNNTAINDYIAAMIAAQEGQLNRQKSSVEQAAEEAARQAYLTRLQNERALPELLAAQGISGGGTESAYLDLLTGYGQNMSRINSEKNSSLNEIDTAIADVYAQAEAERLSQLMANRNNALAAYQNIYGNMADYDLTQQQLAMQQRQYEDSLAQQQYENEQNRNANTLEYTLALAEAGMVDGESLYQVLSGMGYNVSREMADAYVSRIRNELTPQSAYRYSVPVPVPEPEEVSEDAAYVAQLRRLAAESARSGGESAKRAAALIGQAMDEGRIGEATGAELVNLIVRNS